MSENIQWYPGHMHKAGKAIKEMLPRVDVFIEILDARIPFSSENPMLGAMRRGKPCIKILNKSDLADPALTQVWQEFLEREQSVKTLALAPDQQDKLQVLRELCLKLVPTPQTGKLVHALIMGIPNVGKSTLINRLAGRKIAKTGNEPAVTRSLQRIDIGSNIVLLDSPGMLWPNVENRNSGFRLAASGAIKDTAINHDDVALFAAGYLLQHYPELVRERFRLDELPGKDDALLDAIGRKRGCLKSGGRVETDKAAKILLAELRSGALGRITLETPDMMEREMAETAKIREEKAARKLARRLQRKGR
ncbi:MAG: ribosome biogenesis GTPase YlqF [Gammaproteobacteria bacterium]